MSASVNKVILIGNLGAKPELRYTAGRTPVCNLSLATNESWRDARGNLQERTEWHRIVCWKQAENHAKFLDKGRQVFIEGKLQTRSWDDQKSGTKRYTTEIVALSVQYLGGGRKAEETGSEPPTPSDDDAGAGGFAGTAASDTPDTGGGYSDGLGDDFPG